jgi:hypothetical protein
MISLFVSSSAQSVTLRFFPPDRALAMESVVDFVPVD